MEYYWKNRAKELEKSKERYEQKKKDEYGEW
jgi:hypothetical protein